MVESTAVSCILHTFEQLFCGQNYFQRRGERRYPRFFNLSSSTVVFPHSYKNYSASTRNPATPSNSAYRINSSTRILQEILQLQGSSRAGSFQQLFPVSPSILHGRIRLPASLQHSKARQHKQASSNSTRQKQHSTRQPASTQSLQ